MHRFFIFSICFVLFIGGCQTKQDIKSELQNVENVVYEFFDSIADFNYQSIRDKCSDDFILFEDGQVMNVEDFINFLKSFGGKATLSYKFEDVKTNIEGNIAWITLRNKAVMTMNDQQSDFEWLESSVLKKQNGSWKIVLYHSTVVKPKQ